VTRIETRVRTIHRNLEFQCGSADGRKECDFNCHKLVGKKAEFSGRKLLGPRLLCLDRGTVEKAIPKYITKQKTEHDWQEQFNMLHMETPLQRVH
jgi:hypothetical protein